MRLYHNPRCSKSRQCLALLEGEEVEVIRYLESGLSESEVEDLVHRCVDPPSSLVRIAFDGASEHLIQLLVEDPSILQRPLVDDGERVMVCRPPERVLEWLA